MAMNRYWRILCLLRWGKRSCTPYGTFACPICGQEFPHSADDPIHREALDKELG